MKLTLGFSTCPNDTFIFDALVHQRIDTEGLEFELIMEDILHLNQKAIAAGPDIVKISYNAYGHVAGDYRLLRAGGAMGMGVGPLLIAREPANIQQLAQEHAPIAIPGQNTTANLLLNFFAPNLTNRKEMLFHEIMPAVVSGEVAAGVIIHENRFTYQDLGLVCLQDLGAHWEKETGLPIPLGAIAAKRSLGKELIDKIDRLVRQSVEYAFRDRNASAEFVRANAQEMSEAVTRQHIDLYVNAFSVDFGAQGEAAIRRLLAEGQKMQLYPPSRELTQILSGEISPGV